MPDASVSLIIVIGEGQKRISNPGKEFTERQGNTSHSGHVERRIFLPIDRQDALESTDLPRSVFSAIIERLKHVN